MAGTPPAGATEPGAGEADGNTTATSGPDWGAIEADLKTEVDASPGADADAGAPAAQCGGGPPTALGILLATSDTNEFVGNANVELRLEEDDAEAAEDGPADGPEGVQPDGAAEQRPADKSMVTNEANGSAILNPFEPAGTYEISVPVLPEDFADSHMPPNEDENRVVVVEGESTTCIVFIPPKPWIEIKLLDANGEAAKGHPYRLEFPREENGEEPAGDAEANPDADGAAGVEADGAAVDGEEAGGAAADPYLLKAGRLDDDGFARITQDDVPAGVELAACHVVFPTEYNDVPSEAVLNAPDWIKLELLDSLGNPASSWRYEIYAPGNGEEPMYTGALDGVGSALVMVEEADITECEIVFLPPSTVDNFAAERIRGNWVKLEALDPLGDPAANWRYELKVVGRNSVYTGSLDAAGQALVPIFVGDECEVAFAPPIE